jgi:hypothetical protein
VGAVDEAAMNRWADLARAMPDVAEAGRQLLYYHGVGLGFLATIGKDGGPRLHPVCPVIDGDGPFVFIGNHSPKVHDLLRDGRFALHSFPIPEKEFSDAAWMRVGRGRALLLVTHAERSCGLSAGSNGMGDRR